MAPPVATAVDLNSTNPAPPTNEQNIVFSASAAYTETVEVNNQPQTVQVRDCSAVDPVMVGDSGSGGKTGNVPAPPAGSAAAGKFLKADGTWAVPSGGGGSATPVENEVHTGVTGTSITLSHTPSSATGYTQVKGYRNGVRLNPGAGNDFTWSGTAVTLATAAVSADVFVFDYWM